MSKLTQKQLAAKRLLARKNFRDFIHHTFPKYKENRYTIIAQIRMEEFRAIAVSVVKLAREFGWNVGLGHYDWGVHIDVDAEGKSRNRTWDYR